jgi:hypothetical protein
MKLRFPSKSLAIAARIILWTVPMQFVRALCSRPGLKKMGSGAKFASRGKVVVISPFYGNGAMVLPFLAHHRRLGVDRFVFLDLSGTGGLWPLLAGQPDCSVWRPRAATSRGATVHRLNYLRWRHARGRWCLSIDASDFFVFHRCETRQIQDLAEFLEGERRFHLYALILEMYADAPAASLSSAAFEDPLASLPWFDAYGYLTEQRARVAGIQTSGGLQRRALYADTPAQAPALNRVPFIKWKWFYAYTHGTRLLTVPALQAPHGRWHTMPTGCLLRCSLLNDPATLAVALQGASPQGRIDEHAQIEAGAARLRQIALQREISTRYRSSADLLECGLLNPGQWF